MGEGVSPSLSRDGFPVVNHLVVFDSGSCEHGFSCYFSVSFSVFPTWKQVSSDGSFLNQKNQADKGSLLWAGCRILASSVDRASKVGIDVSTFVGADLLVFVVPSSHPVRSDDGEHPKSSVSDQGGGDDDGAADADGPNVAAEGSDFAEAGFKFIAELTQASSEPGGCIVIPKAWVPDPRFHSMPSPTPTEGSMSSDPGGGFSSEFEIPKSWVPDLILVPTASPTMGSTELLSYGSDSPDQSEGFDGAGAGAVGSDLPISTTGGLPSGSLLPANYLVTDSSEARALKVHDADNVGNVDNGIAFAKVAYIAVSGGISSAFQRGVMSCSVPVRSDSSVCHKTPIRSVSSDAREMLGSTEEMQGPASSISDVGGFGAVCWCRSGEMPTGLGFPPVRLLGTTGSRTGLLLSTLSSTLGSSITLDWVYSLVLSMIGLAYRLTGGFGRFWLVESSDLKVITLEYGDVFCRRYGDLRLGPLIFGVLGLLLWRSWE